MATSSVLLRLASTEFWTSYGYIATPAALYRALQSSAEVAAFRSALASGEVSQSMIRALVDSLLAELKAGQPFRHDLTFSAIAVGLERWPDCLAEEYLHDLSQLQLAEMSMSIRVARLCLNRRLTLTRTVRGERHVENLQGPESMNYEQLATRFPQAGTAQSRERYTCQV